MTKTTVLYARVSTDMQNTDKQLDALGAWAAAHGCSDPVLVQDVDVSSKTPLPLRPEGRKIAALIKAGTLGTLVVHKLDRGWRNVQEFLEFSDAASRAGVRIFVVSMFNGDALDMSTPTGRLMVTMLAAVAEFERGVISERTRESMKAAANRGVRVTSRDRINYGYELADEVCPECAGASPACTRCKGKGMLPRMRPQPEEQKILTEVKRMSADGISSTDIADHLRSLGLKYRHSPWTSTRVDKLLGNKITPRQGVR